MLGDMNLTVGIGYTPVMITLILLLVFQDPIEAADDCLCLSPVPNNSCPRNSCEWFCSRQSVTCTRGKVYHCARDYDSDAWLQGCAKEKMCRAGTEPRLSFYENYKTITEPVVYCMPCRDPFMYNKDNTSSANFSDCSYTKKNKCENTYNKIQCGTESWKDSKDRDGYCRCDARRGYAPINDQVKNKCFYDGIPCAKKNCRNATDGSPQQLLLNYTCAPVCGWGFDRTSEDTDDCLPVPIISTPPVPTTTMPNISTVTPSKTTLRPTSPATGNKTSLSTEVSQSKNNIELYIIVPVAVVVVVLIIIIGVIIHVYVCRSSGSNREDVGHCIICSCYATQNLSHHRNEHHHSGEYIQVPMTETECTDIQNPRVGSDTSAYIQVPTTDPEPADGGIPRVGSATSAASPITNYNITVEGNYIENKGHVKNLVIEDKHTNGITDPSTNKPRPSAPVEEENSSDLSKPGVKHDTDPVNPADKHDISPVKPADKHDISPVKPADKHDISPVKPADKHDISPVKPDVKYDNATVKPADKHDNTHKKPDVKHDIGPVKPDVKHISPVKPDVKHDNATVKPADKHDISPVKPDVKHDNATVKPADKHDISPVKPDDKHISPVKPDDKHYISPVKPDDKHYISPVKPDVKHENVTVKPADKHDNTHEKPDVKHDISPVKPDDKHDNATVKPADKHDNTWVKPTDKHDISPVKPDDKHVIGHVKPDDKHDTKTVNRDDKHDKSPVKPDDKDVKEQTNPDDTATAQFDNTTGTLIQEQTADGYPHSIVEPDALASLEEGPIISMNLPENGQKPSSPLSNATLPSATWRKPCKESETPFLEPRIEEEIKFRPYTKASSPSGKGPRKPGGQLQTAHKNSGTGTDSENLPIQIDRNDHKNEDKMHTHEENPSEEIGKAFKSIHSNSASFRDIQTQNVDILRVRRLSEMSNADDEMKESLLEKTIRHTFKFLVDELDLDEVLTKLKKVIDKMLFEDWMNKGKDRSDRINDFLHFIESGDAQRYDQFKDALKESGQAHVLKKLEEMEEIEKKHVDPFNSAFESLEPINHNDMKEYEINQTILIKVHKVLLKYLDIKITPPAMSKVLPVDLYRDITDPNIDASSRKRRFLEYIRSHDKLKELEIALRATKQTKLVNRLAKIRQECLCTSIAEGGKNNDEGNSGENEVGDTMNNISDEENKLKDKNVMDDEQKAVKCNDIESSTVPGSPCQNLSAAKIQPTTEEMPITKHKRKEFQDNLNKYLKIEDEARRQYKEQDGAQNMDCNVTAPPKQEAIQETLVSDLEQPTAEQTSDSKLLNKESQAKVNKYMEIENAERHKPKDQDGGQTLEASLTVPSNQETVPHIQVPDPDATDVHATETPQNVSKDEDMSNDQAEKSQEVLERDAQLILDKLNGQKTLTDLKEFVNNIHEIAKETLGIDMYQFAALPDIKQALIQRIKDNPQELCGVDGYRAFRSSGANNSCMYQSVSWLLKGSEILQNRLRLLAVLHAVKNIERYIDQYFSNYKYKKQSRGHNDDSSTVDSVRDEAVSDFVSLGLEADNLTGDLGNVVKDGITNLVMQTTQYNTDSSRLHVQFLAGALNCSIKQHFPDQFRALEGVDIPFIGIEEGACGSDIPELHILWEKTEGSSDFNHIIPLVKCVQTAVD